MVNIHFWLFRKLRIEEHCSSSLVYRQPGTKVNNERIKNESENLKKYERKNYTMLRIWFHRSGYIRLNSFWKLAVLSEFWNNNKMLEKGKLKNYYRINHRVDCFILLIFVRSWTIRLLFGIILLVFCWSYWLSHLM